MRQKSVPARAPAEQVVKGICRAIDGTSRPRTRSASFWRALHGEDSIAELCRHEGIVQNLYYRWSKDFLEAGKKRLAGDTARAATSDEVKDLRREANALKGSRGRADPREPCAQKKHDRGWGRRHMRYPFAKSSRSSGWSSSRICRSGGRWTRSASPADCVGDGLGPGVDGLIGDLGVFRPVRNPASLQHHAFAHRALTGRSGF
jgi:transposase